MKPIRDAFLNRERGTVTVCYRSGLTVYEEQMNGKRYVSAGWNGAGFPLNILDNFPTRLPAGDFAFPQAFDLQVNGVSLTSSWSFAGFSTEEETLENGTEILHVRVELESGVSPVRVCVHTLLDGTAVLQRELEIENKGDETLNVGGLCVMGGALEEVKQYELYQKERREDGVWSLGYFDCSLWGREGSFRWTPVRPEQTTVYGRNHRGRHRHPMFLLRNELTGTIFMGQFAYSGGYAFRFDCNTENTDRGLATLCWGADLDEEAPAVRIAPGEKYRTPAVHMGMMNGELDDIVYEMHTHIRRTVFTLPPAEAGIVGGLIEAGMGPERTMSVAATKHFADTAAAVGAETMIIDAGWYCPPGRENEWSQRVGDWEYDRELYPNGLEEVRDYIRSRGLRFGMWLDAERLGKASRVAAEHPDWLVKPLNSGVSTLIDMTNPAACAWVERQVAHLIEDYDIDLFRLDYNISGAEMNYRGIDGAAGYPRYCEAVYAMYDRLRRKYPRVIFENCAGGGGRTDLGMLAAFTHSWVSDWQIAPRSVEITNGMTMALPPEYVDRLVSGMNSHTCGSLELMTRQTLFGRPTTNAYNPLGTAFNEEQLAFVRHTFDIYREYIRPYAAEGRIYHHTPECSGPQPQGTVIMERSDADRTVGVIGVFRLADSGRDGDVTVYPRGVDRSRRYRVLFDNEGAETEMSGAEMVNAGLRVRLGQSMAGELIAYRAVTDEK